MEQRSTSLRSRLLVSQESLARPIPSDLKMEEAVLGAIMLEASAMPIVADFLKPEHFFSEAHREIFSAALALYTAGDALDMRTIISVLRKRGKIETVGGAYYIAELSSKVSTSANVEFHSRLLLEFSLKRDIIQVGSEIASRGYDDTMDAFELQEFAALSIESLTEDFVKNTHEKSSQEVSIQAIKELESRMSGIQSGYSTGFKAVDAYFRYSPGELVLLGGRPGQGKSVWAFQSLFHVAESGVPVGAFSLEMPSVKVLERLAAGIAEIDQEQIKMGKISEYEFSRLMDAYGRLSKLTYRIDDSAGLHVSELRSRAKQMVLKYGVKVILCDFAQMLRGRLHGENINRDQEIGVIARGLKTIARENDICVVAIVSLNRGVETRGGDKRPQLQDIRDSSSLESEADVCCFMYRGEVYKILQDENGMPTHGMAEVIVAKNRNGPLGTATLRFVGRNTVFKDWVGENFRVDYTSGMKSPVNKDREEEENLEIPFK